MTIYSSFAKNAKHSVQLFLNTLYHMVSTPPPESIPEELSGIPLKYSKDFPILVSKLEEDLSKELARINEADPRNLYVARLCAYKQSSSLRSLEHELVIATVKRTPREGSLADRNVEYNIVFERFGSKADPDNAITQDKDALDDVDEVPPTRRNRFTKSIDKTLGSMRNCDQVTRVDEIPRGAHSLAVITLKKPPSIPAEYTLDNISTIPDEQPLEGWTDSEQSQRSCKGYMYFYQLAVLARTISDHKGVYDLLEHNCYWYAGMIMQCASLYTGRSITFTQATSGRDAKDNTKSLGTFINIPIVTLSADKTLGVLQAFSLSLHDFEVQICGKRREAFAEKKRLEEAERQLEIERREKEEAQRQVRELTAQLEELQRKAGKYPAPSV